MTETKVTRRRFLKASTLIASAPFILPSFAWAAETKANDRINLGFIGIGRQGRGLLQNFLGMDEAQVVALCDVDATRLRHSQGTANAFYAGSSGRGSSSGVAAYVDFRELLAREDIDGVVISTPDHWHAIIAIAAARAGKDIYCEKPLCQTVNEARAIVNVVREHDCVFQTGSQQRSEIRFRMACEWIRNGRIGKIQRVDVGLPHGIGKWCDLPESSPPEGLDWNFWLGPAPERGWHNDLSPTGVHNNFPNWRKYREYGGGMVTDWGAHHFDIVQWALGMDESGPVKVIPPPDKDAETGTRFIYANGVEVTHAATRNGARFFGSDGEIFVARGVLEITPESKRGEPLPEDAIRLYESNNHRGDWFNCIRSRRKPICDVEIGARSVTVCHLVNMAYWNHQPFDWDPARNQFANGTGDTEWLGAPNRSPWTQPEV